MARDLLGRTIVVATPRSTRRVRIVETEAYRRNDPASHSYRGPTARNRSMFDEPGTLYVYRIHQVHCANVVTVPGEAVLLRAGQPVARTSGDASGPGRLCRWLGVDLGFDGADLSMSRRIWFEGAPDGVRSSVVTGPRVGIRRAVRRPWRFAIQGNPFVSRPRPPRWVSPRAQADDG